MLGCAPLGPAQPHVTLSFGATAVGMDVWQRAGTENAVLC